MNIKIFFVSLAALVLVVAGLVTWGVINSGQKAQVLSGADAKNVLNGAFRNNPQSALAPSVAKDSSKAEDAAVAVSGGQALAPSYMPIYKQFSYSHVKSTTEVGPATSRCAAYAFYKAGSSESFDFYNDKGTWYKYISLDGNGDLNSYSLGNYVYGSKEERTEFRGGSYAVKIITEGSGIRPVPLAAETTGSAAKDSSGTGTGSAALYAPADPINAYFGEGAKVEKVLENGKLAYYIVTWQYKTSCDVNSVFATKSDSAPVAVISNKNEGTSTIVIKSWIKPDTFQSFKQEEYLGSITDENLLVRTETTVESENADFVTVANNFKYDQAAEVKSITVKQVPDQYYAQADYLDYVKETLAVNDLTVLMPGTKYPLQYSYFTADDSAQFAYLIDRAFYPAGDRGEAMYTEAKTNWEQSRYLSPQFELSFGLDSALYSSYSLASFAAGTKGEDILNRYLYIADKSIEPTEITITIGGQNVTGKMYTVTNDVTVAYPEKSGQSVQVRTAEPTKQKNVVVLFNYANQVFAANFYGLSETQKVDAYLNFSAYAGSSSEDMSVVVGRIKEALNRVNVKPVEPSTPGQAEPGGTGSSVTGVKGQ